jgi:carbohydrate kinase (thermoresistant glucokinase family)
VIIIVAGIAGSGKTTVGMLLAERLGCEFEDGDLLHPAANVAKMHAGVPLTDADRWPWLHIIEDWMDQRISAGKTAVIACSALHRRYRAALLDGRPQARLVFLQISREVAVARLARRHGHFFPAKLLDSQFRDLEPPGPDEQVLVVDATQPAADMAAEIATRLDAGAVAGPPPGGGTAPGRPPAAGTAPGRPPGGGTAAGGTAAGGPAGGGG